jgi:hypothetical protein
MLTMYPDLVPLFTRRMGRDGITFIEMYLKRKKLFCKPQDKAM